MPIAKSRPVKKPKEDKTAKKGKEAEKATPASSGASGDEPTESAADLLRQQGIVTTFALNNKKIHRNVRDIIVENLTVLYHGTPLIEEAELTLNYGNRYGLIGRNGCGKSTFMKVIGARSFPMADGIDIFHLSEEIEATDMTAKEAVMSVDKERAKLEAEAELLNEMMTSEDSTEENNDDLMERLTQVYERLEELDAATAETRASKILSGLGFTPERQNKKTREFSGGWRMRIALARALFIQPTLLLLDEPTNHLDMDAVVWLEDYLSKWDKILFMVSHSQDFMNNVCTHIVHLTKKRLDYYTGNYDSFVKTRSEKEEEQEKRFKAEQDQIKHMKEYVARFGQGNAKMAKQAQSKEKTLEKMMRGGLTEKVEHEKALDFKFPDPPKLSPPVLQCQDITFGYPACEILYSNVSFGVDLDSRVALVGPNGAGKSTLLKIMTGELQPLTGSVRPHAHLRISKFTQHFIDVLDLTMTPLDYFLSLWPDMTRDDGRRFLGRFGISGTVQTQVMAQLSDGQKSRVVLAKMAREGPHILFLDEPTNHLDMESIDSLAKAINNFEGGMILVSHDMRLISQVATEIWLCDNRTVSKYVGEIGDFKLQLRRQMQQQNLIDGDGKGPAAAAAPTGPMTAPIVPKSKLSAPQVTMTVAPPAPAFVPKKAAAAASSPAAPAAGAAAETEEEAVKRARMELADLAIAKQRARQAAEAKAKEEGGSAAAGASTGAADGAGKAGVTYDENGNEINAAKQKEEEKAYLKSKRKQEKEAAEALEKKLEEDRQRRREELLRDAEEAKKLKEEKEKSLMEFREQKAAREAKKKAEEEAAAELLAIEVAKRKAEREARKLAKHQARLEAQEKARLATEQAVLADPWTQEQQILFEEALLKYTSSMDKLERWTAVSKAVGDKTKNQCMARYRYLKEYVIEKRQINEQHDAVAAYHF